MDQPKPSSIAPNNPALISEKPCPELRKIIMDLVRSKLLQNSSLQLSNQSSSTNLNSQKQSQAINLGSSGDSSTASSPLSPFLPSLDSSSSFLLSAKQFQSQQPSSSLSTLNLGSLVNLSLASSAVLLSASSAVSNKRSKNNSQSKSGLSNSKNHGSNSNLKSLSAEINTPTIKTKKKKIAFKFDNRKYVRRSFTPMCELLQPVKVPSPDYYPPTSDSDPSIKRSNSITLSEDNFDINIDEFDRVKAHQTLELYEARIQMGLDDRHLHPALAIKAADEECCTVFSKEEVKRFENYNEINVYQPRPNFWPPRVWDDQSNSSVLDANNNDDENPAADKGLTKKPSELTEQQSEKLMQMMEDSYKIPEIEVTYYSKSSKTHKKKRPHRTLSSSSSTSRLTGIKNLRNQKSLNNPPSVINLYAINVMTDDSDDTDLENF